MTKLVFFMLLSAAAAPSVQAGDTKDSLRDVMDICNQFVINDPDPSASITTMVAIFTTTGMPPGAEGPLSQAHRMAGLVPAIRHARAVQVAMPTRVLCFWTAENKMQKGELLHAQFLRGPLG